ncbi:hypothetical protein GCM10007863_29500 [Dyella mobilis]|nr:hypothetical protein GCM10007863_29500 [Dyella mobilis]
MRPRLVGSAVLFLHFCLLTCNSLAPVLRARLREKLNRGAGSQSFLVETIAGIDTVKAMAVEPQLARRWGRRLAGGVEAGFRIIALGAAAREGVNVGVEHDSRYQIIVATNVGK